MQKLLLALESWGLAIGSGNVITDQASCLEFATTTFSSKHKISAIIFPGSTVDIQQCVSIANLYGVSIYPVSTGKNWGFGSAVPTENNCVVMDLGRLNRILDFNEKLAYITVEPGVTFHQVYTYLQEQKSRLMISVPGTTPYASVIGNTLERGHGAGPYIDRFAHVCGMEIVLPTGERLHTGFERFAGAVSAKTNRWGVGPYLDGLFTQSNFGIVTKMTIWLTYIPEYFQVCHFGIDNDDNLENVINTIQSLKLRGIIKFPVTFWNDWKMITSMQQYPWQEANGITPLPDPIRNRIKRDYYIYRWSGWIGLYTNNKMLGDIDRELITNYLGSIVDRLIFIGDDGAYIVKSSLPFDIENTTDFRSSTFLGVPNHSSLACAYWRKSLEIPSNIDIDRDKCGKITISISSPFLGDIVNSAITLIEQIINEYGFEPVISFIGTDERNVDIIAFILYDREVPGDDDIAVQCHNILLHKLIQIGFLPNRLGLLSMRSLPSPIDDYQEVITRIKNSLDSNNTLSPGRYDASNKQ